MKQVLLTVIAMVAGAVAMAADHPSRSTPEIAPGRYIVEWDDPPVLAFDGQGDGRGGWKMAPTRPGSAIFDPSAKSVIEYRRFLDRRAEQMLKSVSTILAAPATPIHRYRFALNGVALALSPTEAERLATLRGVKKVSSVTVHRPHTDAGPAWIGAPGAWGASGSMGEGVVVGIVDSGVNWDHPAFADIGGDGFDHNNPRGRQYGLCSNAQVRCNDKLIGVYDFTEEGARIGRDLDGHGTHVASTAAGNIHPSNFVSNTGSVVRELSGVAPHANLITYKVCLADDLSTPDVDENVCLLDAILSAFEQIVIDQVDVVNYSIGGSSSDPWADNDALAILTARDAGVLTVTSAGNDGSAPDTISSPANAPWLLAVANISHNRRFENILENLTGGNGTPPANISGAGLATAFGPAKIVHARDFGNALCGVGEAELQSSCGAHSGSSNPFSPGTFDGEIVVCDRGTYGRIEKGFNLRAAGAGGYVLANTAAQGETLSSDDHCLPATHIGAQGGDALRAWLNAGGDSLTGQIAASSSLTDDSLGDRVSASSSRGPDGFVPNVIKPEVAAPGSNILAAGVSGNTSSFKSGTSMASPHVAGSAALLLSLRPELSPSAVHSLLVTTAFNNQMLDSDGSSIADGFDVGAGRVNPEAAVRAGLVMEVNRAEFLLANPNQGGRPQTLNLPTLASNRCVDSCVFQRQVRALDGGRWSASIASDTAATGQVSPESFSLAAGELLDIAITLNVSDPSLIGQSVDGYVVLTPEDESVATQRLAFKVTADGGDLPAVLSIETANNRGSEIVELSGLVSLPQATLDTYALTRARVTNRLLSEDATNADPYNNFSGGGAYFVTVSVENTGDMLFVELDTAAQGADLDLFVGRDLDGASRPDLNEELCRSTSSGGREICVLPSAQNGQYWILVQNWQASSPGGTDPTVLVHAVVGAEANQSLIATGPGSVPAQAPFAVRLSWNQGLMAENDRWVGALALKPTAQLPTVGVIPVVLSRLSDGGSGTAAAPDMETQEPLLLLDGGTETLTLSPHQGHSRLFVDLPSSSSNQTLSIVASPQIEWQVVTQAVAFDAPNVASGSAAGAQVIASGQGNGQVSTNLSAQRIYLIPVNTDTQSQTLSATFTQERTRASALQTAAGVGGAPLPGLWFNPARDGTGFNLNQIDGQLIVEWYTYLEDGTPVWYLAQAPVAEEDDYWQAPLNQFRWDGTAASATQVGTMTLIFESRDKAILNFRLHGRSGSEPYQVIVDDLSCTSNGAEVARTGLWFMPEQPGFGYSILNVGGDQVHVNYLYGPTGLPRWVLGQGQADSEQITLAQFSGFCPSCATSQVTSTVVGTNRLNYDSAQSGSVDTQVQFSQPLSGAWNQAGALSNLTPQISCN